MYSNIGGKIKTLAVVLCFFGIIASVFYGSFFVATHSDEGIAIGILIAVVGSILSWFGSFVLYGFGQLVENSDDIYSEVHEIHKKICGDDKTGAD